MHQSVLEQRVEELLELIWTLDEEGEHTVDAICGAAPRRADEDHPNEILDELESRGFITQHGGEVALTALGGRQARSIVRRHRLAERLLNDVLSLDESTMARAACRFEHVLSEEVTDSICTLLGHPPTCPHGQPIPPGPCCGEALREVRPLVRRLADMQVGQGGAISLLGARRDGRLERLGALGLVPGVRIRLVQRRPAYVLQVAETEIAIDHELASEIYVRTV
ncbi:MAG: metal-dependent transcriptional regulator [Candidatus Eiseniibacteriota bacterium]